MTDEAKKLNKDVVIYPHDHHFIDNAEDAVSYIKEVNADNLFTRYIYVMNYGKEISIE